MKKGMNKHNHNERDQKVLLIAFMLALASGFGFCQADARKFQMNFGTIPGDKLVHLDHLPADGQIKKPPRPPGSHGSPAVLYPNPPPPGHSSSIPARYLNSDQKQHA